MSPLMKRERLETGTQLVSITSCVPVSALSRTRRSFGVGSVFVVSCTDTKSFAGIDGSRNSKISTFLYNTPVQYR